MLIRNASALFFGVFAAAALQCLLYAPLLLVGMGGAGLLFLFGLFWHSAIWLSALGCLIALPLYLWRGQRRRHGIEPYIQAALPIGVIWAYAQLPMILRALPNGFWGDHVGSRFGALAQTALVLGGGTAALAASAAGGALFWLIAVKRRPVIDPFNLPPEAAVVPQMWPGLLTGLLALALVLLCASVNLASTGVVVLLVLVVTFAGIWSVVAAVGAARAISLRAWPAAAAQAILPIGLVLMLDPGIGFTAPKLAGDLVHFISARDRFDAQVAAQKAEAAITRDPAFLFFQWRGDEVDFQGLVFDESDSAAQPEGSRPRDWYPLRRYPGLHCEARGFIALWDHYYLAAFRWS